MTLLRRAVYDNGDDKRSFLLENGLLIDEINLSCWGKLVLIGEPLSAEATDDVRGTIAVRCLLVVCWIILDDADSTALLFIHAVDSTDMISVYFCCFDCGFLLVVGFSCHRPSSTPLRFCGFA